MEPPRNPPAALEDAGVEWQWVSRQCIGRGVKTTAGSIRADKIVAAIRAILAAPQPSPEPGIPDGSIGMEGLQHNALLRQMHAKAIASGAATLWGGMLSAR